MPPAAGVAVKQLTAELGPARIGAVPQIFERIAVEPLRAPVRQAGQQDRVVLRGAGPDVRGGEPELRRSIDSDPGAADEDEVVDIEVVLVCGGADKQRTVAVPENGEVRAGAIVRRA